MVDRLYVYDNSVVNEDARLLFRLSNGVISKMYVADVPEWARFYCPTNTPPDTRNPRFKGEFSDYNPQIIGKFGDYNH